LFRKIDIETWKRREHFSYFCSLDDPYWGLTTELDCTSTYRQAKEYNHSFFLSYLHKAMLAVHQIEELRMRIVENEVVCYEQIHASATVLRQDETFGCCFIEFDESFAAFSAKAAEAIKQTMTTTGMCLEQDYRLNQMHVSSIPWIHFTGLTYAKSLKPQDTIPKFTFGKILKSSDKITFPVSVQVHHGLVDGLHVARFLDLYQKLLNPQA